MTLQETDFVPADAATRFRKNIKAQHRFELFGLFMGWAFCFWAGFVVGVLVMLVL